MPLLRVLPERRGFHLSEMECVMVIRRTLSQLALTVRIADLPSSDPRRVAWYAMYHAAEAYAGGIPCQLCGAEEREYHGEQTRCAGCGCILRVA